jgi:NAD-dependent dihydropyrimidine dehydrogenase PreA subunit
LATGKALRAMSRDRFCLATKFPGANIPKLIALYNEANHADAFSWMQIGFTLDAMKEAELPASCIVCGSCAHVCPRNNNSLEENKDK